MRWQGLRDNNHAGVGPGGRTATHPYADCQRSRSTFAVVGLDSEPIRLAIGPTRKRAPAARRNCRVLAYGVFSTRLPHVVTRKDLALMLAPTYAASANVDFDEAHERMQRALDNQRIADALYQGLSSALEERQGPRTSVDELIDELSAGVQKRRSRVKAAGLTPPISAVMVLLNLELGYAAEMMRNALENPKGKALLQEGLHALGAHLVSQLIK